MTSISEPEANRLQGVYTPADLLDLCAGLDKMLRVTEHGGYSPKLDATYRKCRLALVGGLRQESLLRRVGDQFDKVLPSSLAAFAANDLIARSEWDHEVYGGRAILVQLQGDLLTALDAAGCPPEWASDSAKPAESKPAGTPRPVPGPVPNRTQLQAAQNKARARELRGQGSLIKEIARALGCTERTVYVYLEDGNESPAI